VIFYVGDGIDQLSLYETERVALILPPEIRVISVPLRRSYDRVLLDALAARSGGRVLPMSPDDPIAWRCFDLVSSLRSPEWANLDPVLLDATGDEIDVPIYRDRHGLRDGESVRLVAQLGALEARSIRLGGKTFSLPASRKGRGWVPRLWAKLRIEALERDSAAEHRDAIVALSKEHYVMTPFTSLLVLENDAMYEQYKVDRGRKDHWVRYAAPTTWNGKSRAPKFEQTVYFSGGWRYQPGGEVRWGQPDTTRWYRNGRLWDDQFLNGVINYDDFFLTGNLLTDFDVDLDGDGIPFGDVLYADRFLRGDVNGDGLADQYTYLFSMATPQTRRLLDRTTSIAGFERFSFRGVGGQTESFIDLPRVSTGFEVNYLSSLDFSVHANSPFDDFRGGSAGGFPPQYYGFFVVPTKQGATQKVVGSAKLQSFLNAKSDTAVTFGDWRLVSFSNGEFLLRSGDRAALLWKNYCSWYDPLLGVSYYDSQSAGTVASRVPWFLRSYAQLSGLSKVSEETESKEGKTTVRLDRGVLTFTEIEFQNDRPLELRRVLRGGLVLSRVVYSEWTAVGGRQLPTEGSVYGADDQLISSFQYRWEAPNDDDRARLAKFQSDRSVSGVAHLSHAVRSFAAGDDSAAEAFLRSVAKDNITDAHRRFARIVALASQKPPVYDAPELDPKDPQVARWLRKEVAIDETKLLRQALEGGEIDLLWRVLAKTKEPKRCVETLERECVGFPKEWIAVVDLAIADLAQRLEWKLKAYGALDRARRVEPFAKSVTIEDRLSTLAVQLGEFDLAFDHAEKAIKLLGRPSSRVLAKRYQKMAEIAEQNSEQWEKRGLAFLTKWADLDPRSDKVFEKLVVHYRERRDAKNALRYASQALEFKPTKEAYERVIKELEFFTEVRRATHVRERAKRLK
ncbi:MAG: tetratricopeptide repeat protein, partial [Planctomycetota bacterium]